MANNYKVKTFSNSSTGTSQALFTAAAATNLVKSVIVNCDKTTPNVNAILRIKKSGGTEELIKKQNITSQTVSYEMLYDVLPLEAGDSLYAQSDDTDITWIMSWVENTASVIGQSIDVLSDVDTTGVADGDVLTYNSTSGNWEAEASAGGSSFGTVAVSGQSNVVADASNDTLTIEAGTGITITTNATTDTVTITNSATGANAFGNVAVAGQTTVAADSTNDTLTIAAGTGITLTTDAGTDTLTITNSVTAPNTFGTIAVATQSNVVADSTTDTLTFAVAGGMAITTNATTDTITFDSARLDDDDVSLSGIREIDLNGENLNIVNGAFNMLLIEADAIVMTDPVITNYSGTTGGKVTLTEASANGASAISIKAPDSLTVNTTYTLPSADGTSGQVLATNSAGGLSWTTRAANSFETVAVAGQSSIVADTHTDTLTIAAGSGITLSTDASTDTLTITNSGTANNTFSTIAVAGQSDVVADSASDTLTLTAGSNITLTTNATTDTITIAASGGSPTGSSGQIQYNASGSFGAEAALFYDATNNRLSVGGNTSPAATIVVRGAGTSTASALRVENSGGTERWLIRDNAQTTLTEDSGVASSSYSLEIVGSKNQYWRPCIGLRSTQLTSAVASQLGTTTSFGLISPGNVSPVDGGINFLAAAGNSASANTWQLGGFHGSTAPTAAIAKIVGYKSTGVGSNVGNLAASELILQVINNASNLFQVLGSGAVGILNSAPTSTTSLTVRGQGTSTNNTLLVENSSGTARFTVRDDGGYAFAGGTVGAAQTGYTTFTNLTTDRTCDANATTVEELADILGTLIVDLKTKGIISA